jgi:hypothetical protein
MTAKIALFSWDRRRIGEFSSGNDHRNSSCQRITKLVTMTTRILKCEIISLYLCLNVDFSPFISCIISNLHRFISCILLMSKFEIVLHHPVVTTSRLFKNHLIGISSFLLDTNSILIQNCCNCRIICACMQLRCRDCNDLLFCLFSTTNPTIESSHSLEFACLTVFYQQLEGQDEASFFCPFSSTFLFYLFPYFFS